MNKTTQSQIERALFINRFFAFLVDSFIVSLFIVSFRYFGYFLIDSFNWPVLGKTILFGFVIPLMFTLYYFAIYASKYKGQTFGKRFARIKVVSMSGKDLTPGHFLIREFIARGTFYVLALFIGFYSILWAFTYLPSLGNDRLTLHDYLTGTQVIKTDPYD